MRGERIFGMDFTDIVERDRNLEIAASFSSDGTSNAPTWREYLFNLAPKGWFDRNKAIIARLHTDYSLPAIDPISRRFDITKLSQFSSQSAAAIEGDRRLYIAGMVLPAVDKAAFKFALGQVDLDLARVACALERHRLSKGRYPESLAVLKPEFLAAIPHDIMDGQPLRYRLNDGKFVLYSIGFNQSDDGGKAVFKEGNGKKTWQREEGDWVWSYSEAANR